MTNQEKENLTIAIFLFGIAIVFIIIGSISWAKNPSSKICLAEYYFGGKLIGMGKERIKQC